MAVFSPGSRAEAPFSVAGKPLRRRAANLGVAQKQTPDSPRRCVNALNVRLLEAGSSASTMSRRSFRPSDVCVTTGNRFAGTPPPNPSVWPNLAAVSLEAPNPYDARRQMMAVISDANPRFEYVALPRRLADGRWHRYRLVVYPDGEVRWFADGIEAMPPTTASRSRTMARPPRRCAQARPASPAPTMTKAPNVRMAKIGTAMKWRRLSPHRVTSGSNRVVWIGNQRPSATMARPSVGR